MAAVKLSELMRQKMLLSFEVFHQTDEYRALGMNGIHLYVLNQWKDVSDIIDQSGVRTLV